VNYQLTDFQNRRAPSRSRQRIRPLRLFWLSLTWFSTIGVLFLLYQLWGTGIYESQSQGTLSQSFDLIGAYQSDVPASTIAPTTTLIDIIPSDSGSTTTTIAPPDDEALQAIRQVVAAEDGDVVARMTVPAIGLDKYVVEGVGIDNLRSAVGRYRGTSHIGDNGNVALAGHRTTYGSPFGRINELVPGDQIIFETPVGVATYEVVDPTASLVLWGRSVKSLGSGHVIVGPDDEFVLSDVGDNRLTLTACHPKFSAEERIVVVAQLVGKRLTMLDPLFGIPTVVIEPSDTPTPTTTPAPLVARVRTSSVQTLSVSMNGLPNQLAPSFVFGLLTLVVMAAVSVASNKYGRMIALPVGAAPFIYTLWLFFTHLERLLPAY
jgi:sortase A